MWSSLVSNAAPGSHPEVNRLNGILQHYEAENQRLKMDLEAAVAANQANIERLGEAEKNRQGLQKQIRSLQGSIKFDKIASDGIAKKAGALEFEVDNLREERKVLIEDQIISRKRLAYLEQAVNDDRSKLLREMHENDALRRQKAVLEAQIAKMDKELTDARRELITKCEKLEVIMIQNENQQRVLHEQNEEVLKISHEIAGLKEEKRHLSEQIINQEHTISEKVKDRGEFQDEVSRLRTEISTLARTNSEKSIAYASFGPRAKTSQMGGRSKVSTRQGSRQSSRQGTASDLPDLNGLMNLESMSRVNTSQSNFNSNNNSNNNNNNLTINTNLNGTADLSLWDFSDGSVYDSIPSTFNRKGLSSAQPWSTSPLSSPMRPHHLHKPQSASKQAALTKSLSAPTRTRFLGSGLGFENDTSEAVPSQGSAKQVLKKIMEDFENR